MGNRHDAPPPPLAQPSVRDSFAVEVTLSCRLVLITEVFTRSQEQEKTMARGGALEASADSAIRVLLPTAVSQDCSTSTHSADKPLPPQTQVVL